MAANRLSSLNVVLLVITMASVLLAIYSFVQGGKRNGNGANNSSIADHDLPFNPGRCGLGPKDSPKRPNPPSGKSGTTDGGSSHSTDNPGYPAPNPGPGHTYDNSQPPPDYIPSVESNPTDVGTAAISGVVVDAFGKPVAGIAVTARRNNFNEPLPQFDGVDFDRYKSEIAAYMANVGRETRNARSDSEGRFSFMRLDEGLSYNIRAGTPGQGTASLDRVAAGDNVRLVLSLEGTLRGVIKGPGGKPVTRFSITAAIPNNTWNQKTQNFNSPDGSYSMNIPYGPRTVTVKATGYAPIKGLDVTIGANAAEANFNLGAGAILSGVVTDQGGKPLAETSITILATMTDKDAIDMDFSGDENFTRSRRIPSNPGAYSANTLTDTHGRYRFDGLPPGEYKVTAVYGDSRQEQTTNVPASAETRQNFSLDGGVRVSIRLTDHNGAPLDPDYIWFQTPRGGGGQAKKLPTVERGLVEYAGLKAGEYNITVTATGYPQFKRTEKLGEGQINRFSFQMEQGANLTGVVSTSTSTGIGSGFQVRLVREGDSSGGGRNSQVQADGTFKLGPVEVGDWNLELMNPNWQPVHKEKVRLSAGDNKVTLRVDTGGTLVLTIVQENGSPIGWANVTLTGTGTDKRTFTGYANQGKVTIAFIPTGNYKMNIQTQTGNQPEREVFIRNGVHEETITVRAPNCVKITSIGPNSQAASIGLKVGDLLFEYNGKKVNNLQDIAQFVRETTDADSVTLIVERGGAPMTFTLRGGLIGIGGEDFTR